MPLFTYLTALDAQKQPVALAPHLTWPLFTGGREVYQDHFNLWNQMIGLAIGSPEVDNPRFARPLSFNEDFINTYYSRNASADSSKMSFAFPIDLATITDADVITVFVPGFAGTIDKIFFTTDVVASTPAKLSTLTTEIDTTDLTGGVLSLTTVACDTKGEVLNATAITAANVFTAAQSISVKASGTTPFVEGSGSITLICSMTQAESDPSGTFSSVTDRGAWLVSLTDSGGDGSEVVGTPIDGAAGASAHGGWGTFTTNNATSDKVNVQVIGESFKFIVGKPMDAELKLAVEDVSETEFFGGVAVSTTNAYGTAGAGDTGGHVGFVLKGTDGSIFFNVMKSGGTLTQTDTGLAFVDGSIITFETANVVHRLGWRWDGVDTITPTVDGVDITAAAVTEGSGTQEIPTDVCMSPVMCILTQANTAETFWADYIDLNQAR